MIEQRYHLLQVQQRVGFMTCDSDRSVAGYRTIEDRPHYSRTSTVRVGEGAHGPRGRAISGQARNPRVAFAW